MRFARLNHNALAVGILFSFLWAATSTLSAAGVTVITHGNNSSTTNWVTGMANALSARLGGNVPIYRIDVNATTNGLVTGIAKVSGGDPLTSTSGELIVMLDWRHVSNDDTTTFDVATVAAPLFAQTNLIGELGGSALGEFPIHVIGHSRGASLVCELSKILGEQGLWLDQVTGLDAFPLGSDAPADSYENVLFADSYYQTANFFIDGQIVPGSAWRKLTDVSDGYNGFFINGHSDVHLWYHGGIDLGTPATNGDSEGGDPVTITSAMRGAWWTVFEQAGTNAGFVYSYQGGGNRLSSNQPNGGNSSLIRDGFNRYYDVGGGAGPNNRTAIGINSGEWPNPIRFDLVTTNVVEQGDTATLEIYFQWAQPTVLTQTVQVLADVDQNPLSGNEILLEDGYVTGTLADVTNGTIDINLDGALLSAGDYQLFVKMTGGDRTRFLYAPQPIKVTASTQPLVLDIAAATNSMVLVGINGVAGQTAVLETSVDALPWLPVATNTLTSTRWETVETLDPAVTLTLFRAVLMSP